MADLRIGNLAGVAAKGGTTLLATVTADGSNTVTVDTVKDVLLGTVIDIVNISTGAVLASARTVNGIVFTTAPAGTITYSGADVTATTSHGIYRTGQYAANPTNINGGAAPDIGLLMNREQSIADMKLRLTAIDATFYTAARLNSLTYNDLVYAVRVADYAGSI